MLIYNTMRFGTDVFTLAGASAPTEPVDPDDIAAEEPVTLPGDNTGGSSGSEVIDDPTLPKVAVRIDGKVYHFKIAEASA